MRLLAVDDFMPIAEQKFPEKTEKPQENSLRKTAQYCILAFSFYFHLKMSCWPGMSIIKKQRQSGRYHWRAVMLAMAAMTSKHQHCLELANTPHAPVKWEVHSRRQAGPSHSNRTFFSITSWPEPPYVFLTLLVTSANHENIRYEDRNQTRLAGWFLAHGNTDCGPSGLALASR